MKIKVFNSPTGELPGFEKANYWVNERLLVGVGSICNRLNKNQQLKITDILLTNSFLDHFKDLCFLLENTQLEDRPTIQVYASAETINALKNHIFNGVIWTDYTQVKNSLGQPLLKLTSVDREFSIANFSVTPFETSPLSGALGFIVDDGDSQVIFTGSSGPASAIWNTANQCNNLKAIFTEVGQLSHLKSLDKDKDLFSIQTLSEGVRFLKRPTTPIYIGHFATPHFIQLLEEFQNNANTQLKPLHTDDEISFS